MSDPLYEKSYFVQSKDVKDFEDSWDLRLVAESDSTQIIEKKDAEIIRLKPLAANGIVLANLLQKAEAEIEKWEKRVEEALKEIEQREDGIELLHGNLNECTERGAEAERKIVDLKERCRINPTLLQYNKGLAYWQERGAEAERKLEQALSDNTAIRKSREVYAEQNERLANQLEEAERKLKAMIAKDRFYWSRWTEAKANLKKAIDALKKSRDYIDTEYGIFQVNKTLADIEEEPYRHQGVSGEYTGASNKIEREKPQTVEYRDGTIECVEEPVMDEDEPEEPDWEWIIGGMNQKIEDDDTKLAAKMCEAILWLWEQIKK